MSHLREIKKSLLDDVQQTIDSSPNQRNAQNRIFYDPLTPRDKKQRNLWILRGLLTTACLYVIIICASASVMYKEYYMRNQQEETLDQNHGDKTFVEIVSDFIRRRF